MTLADFLFANVRRTHSSMQSITDMRSRRTQTAIKLQLSLRIKTNKHEKILTARVCGSSLFTRSELEDRGEATPTSSIVRVRHQLLNNRTTSEREGSRQQAYKVFDIEVMVYRRLTVREAARVQLEIGSSLISPTMMLSF